MALTNAQAAALVSDALNAGHTLSIACPNGDTLTVGREHTATAQSAPFVALRWGRSRWAEPCGKPVAWDPMARFIAHDVVEHCGRGAAAKAAREALAK